MTPSRRTVEHIGSDERACVNGNAGAEASLRRSRPGREPLRATAPAPAIREASPRGRAWRGADRTHRAAGHDERSEAPKSPATLATAGEHASQLSNPRRASP